MASKSRSGTTNKKRAAARAKAHDRRLLEQAERDERELVDTMRRGDVISWHRLQASRLRRVADGLRVSLKQAGCFRELISLANEFDEMGDQYLMGKVVRP